MKNRRDEFVNNDEGAVTVDWVVLCAAVVALGALATTQLTDSAVSVGNTIAGSISD
jgi:hypothetical protein